MIELNHGRVRSLEWRRPVCTSSACVEVATEHGYVLVRSSKLPLEVIRFTPTEWEVFLSSAKVGVFDLIDLGEPD